MERARSSDGTEIAFQRHGQGDVIVVVHGTVGSQGDWAMCVPLLVDRFTVVTMDRRGRGASGDGPQHSLDQEVDDVVAVLDVVGEPAHLIGHSYGARLGLLAAARSPLVRSLLLYEPPIAVRHAPADLAGRVEALIAAGEVDVAIDTFLTEAAALPAAEQELIRSIPPVIEEIRRTTPTVPREIRALQAAGAPTAAQAEAVSVPVLVLVGERQDAPIYLDGLDDLQAAFPRADRAILAGQGHVGTAFAPDAFADVVSNFVATV